MSEHSIVFMRFTHRATGESLYLVGSSVEGMKEDAIRFGRFSEAEATAEVISHDDAAIEAEKRCYSPRLFRDAMRAVRRGSKSYYLFG